MGHKGKIISSQFTPLDGYHLFYFGRFIRRKFIETRITKLSKLSSRL